MGFFDKFFGSKKQSRVEVVPDRIWMSAAAKFAGLAKEAKERSNSDTIAIMLVAHFSDVLQQLEKIADQHHSAVPVRAVLASNLNSELAASLQADPSATIDVIVAERHPLPSVDDRLELFAEDLPCRCRFTHHVSLDDPVMKIFASDWIKPILGKLGMSEDEAIESQMVSSRIRLAQQKIESKKYGNLGAESAADWLRNNCPDLWNK